MHWHPDLSWFKDSPDAGDPTCTCSWCGIVIAALDEGPRLWWRFQELRFHLACWEWVATYERLLRDAPPAAEAVEGTCCPGAQWLRKAAPDPDVCPVTVAGLLALWGEAA